MSEQLWTADLTAEQLETWLKPPRNDAPFAIVERLDDLDFPASHEPIVLAVWQQGRIFGATFELKWEKQDVSYRVWLVGQQGAEGFQTSGRLQDTRTEKFCSYLWGPDERRIARKMTYRAMPDGSGRPRLVRHQFRRADGVLVYERFVRMEWEDKP